MSARVMARWIAAVGALGALANVIVAVQGFVLPPEPSALVRHAATAFVACLLALFAQTWFAVFAVLQAPPVQLNILLRL